jgi:hypothetical protein
VALLCHSQMSSLGLTSCWAKPMILLHLQETTPTSKSVRAPAPDSEMVYAPRLAILITLVLALGFESAYGHRFSDQTRVIGPQIGTTQNESDTYKHAEAFTRQLRSGQTGQASLLNNVRASAKVNRTRAVWLTSIKDRGASITIEGMAISADAVTEMISNLQSTGYFTNIEIKETYQDDTKNKMQAFKFQLTCEVDTPPIARPRT